MRYGKTCCFAGYRPQKLPWGFCEDDPRCLRLKLELEELIDRAAHLGYARFISGMALGVDMYAAEAVLKLKERGASVALECAIPCPFQENGWPPSQRERYRHLLELCDAKTLISPSYTPSCMAERNRYMVDSSELLIAVFDGAPGGTSQTVAYARRRGVEIWTINPSLFK